MDLSELVRVSREAESEGDQSRMADCLSSWTAFGERFLADPAGETVASHPLVVDMITMEPTDLREAYRFSYEENPEWRHEHLVEVFGDSFQGIDGERRRDRCVSILDAMQARLFGTTDEVLAHRMSAHASGFMEADAGGVDRVLDYVTGLFRAWREDLMIMTEVMGLVATRSADRNAT